MKITKECLKKGDKIMNKITLRKFTIHPIYNVPSIEVLVDGCIEGYLTPFRGYYFQISRTYDGVHTLARSINHSDNLNFYLTAIDSLNISIFKSLALTALHNYAMNLKDTIVDIELVSLGNSQFDDFIEESIKWVKDNE
jgi:hypothetical protein